MAPRGMITVTTVLFCIILGPLIPAPATCFPNSKICCTRYRRSPVSIQRIKGYREQPVTENCRIEAIIFYMPNKIEVCATREDAWVRRALALLSSKLRRMSKAGSAAAEAKKKSGNLSLNNGSGSFVNTTEMFLNNTESFY
ncbi:C-C motif chemokine 21c-like [Seriola lalandi dorsalis]|uniref:C-C motif chemokine 21c-like n=1 Tax=Seriola lalandi dorsalis TaxID=1841481 RepID=A0A3B4Y5C3_SERLL|nr:C-C motif chemokine 21c-like [Seriola lalandi dorsalis]XP_056247924.1 C-C motif chemokine 21b-like [Seriola aureovittata]